jgi:hypothetical protein
MVTLTRPQGVWVPGAKPVDDAVDNGARRRGVAVLWMDDGVVRSVMHQSSTGRKASWAARTLVIPNVHSTEDDEEFYL